MQLQQFVALSKQRRQIILELELTHCDFSNRESFNNLCIALLDCTNLKILEIADIDDEILKLSAADLIKFCETLASCGFLNRTNINPFYNSLIIRAIKSAINKNSKFDEYQFFAKSHAKEILINIANKGILPPQALTPSGFYLRSIDEAGFELGSVSTKISVTFVAGDRIGANLTPALEYISSNQFGGIWSITAERFYSQKFANPIKLLQTLEARIQSNIVFILKVPQNYAEDYRLDLMSCYTEVRIYDGLVAENIIAILTASTFYPLVAEIFAGTNIEIIQVPDTQITCRDLQLGCTLQNIECETSSGTLTRGSLKAELQKSYGKIKLQAPDYRTSFAELLNTKLKDQQFFCHATRLPTVTDIQILLEKGLVNPIKWLAWQAAATVEAEAAAAAPLATELRQNPQIAARQEAEQLSPDDLAKLVADTNKVMQQISIANLLTTQPNIVFSSSELLPFNRMALTTSTENTAELLSEANKVLFYIKNGFALN